MNKIEGLPMTLPDKNLPFTFKCKGTISKFTYTGDFIVRVPGVREFSQIGIELARVNEGMPLESLDVNTARLNNAVAFLRITLQEAPEWFTNVEGLDYGMNTDDINVVTSLFKQANDLVEGWHKKLKGKGKPKSEGKRSEAS